MTSGLYKQVPRKDATLKLRMIFPSTFTIAVSQSSQSLEQGPRKVPGLRVRCPAGVNRARLLGGSRHFQLPDGRVSCAAQVARPRRVERAGSLLWGRHPWRR